MSVKIADNITSPLGLSTKENVRHVLRGESRLRKYEGRWHLPEAFVASLFSDVQHGELDVPGLTSFEAIVIRSATKAIDEAKANDASFNPSADNVVFILSTTKANVAHLTDKELYIIPSDSARRIASIIGVNTPPIVVCNACVSGLSAIILADRLIGSKTYDYAIVAGADEQSSFIVSGFQSLKALSAEPCKPFDIERTGLNLGEASATVILASDDSHSASSWHVNCGAMSNDAFHISAPSKKGIGLQQVLHEIMQDTRVENIAVINAHGTATLFNDQMEGIAIREQGLTDIPVNSLKGYFGHTMGAAGIVETIITMHALDEGIIPGTRGFEEIGVSARLNISSQPQTTDKKQFIKLLSGFGGCNAGILCSQHHAHGELQRRRGCGVSRTPSATYGPAHEVILTESEVTVDGRRLPTVNRGVALLTELYKTYVGDYPKFYKMDHLCQLGFIASELLIKAEKEGPYKESERGVILFNCNSSTDADRRFYDTIKDSSAFFPSPSIFVYTLPNIVTGEIAIRNNYQGESCFYLLPRSDERQMNEVINATFYGSLLTSAITGWVDFEDNNHFNADLKIIETTKQT